MGRLLAAPPQQQALGVGEFFRLGFSQSLPERAQRVGIESDWLALFKRVVRDRGRWSRRIDPGPRKTPDAERLLAHEMAPDNATFRLIGPTAGSAG